MTEYLHYRFKKTNVGLLLAWCAAVFAYYAWKQSKDAAHHSRQTRALMNATANDIANAVDEDTDE